MGDGLQEVSADAAEAADALGQVGDGVQDVGDGAGGANSRLQDFTNTLFSLSLVQDIVSALADKLGDVAAMADEWANLKGTVALVTQEHGALGAAMERVRAIADDTSTDISATADLYSTLTRALKSLGDRQTDVGALTQTINQSFAVSGASAAETAGTVTQLSQALASGQLRGDEFNSVMEQGPRLAQALADSLGVTTGELRAMAEEGQLTAQTVIGALSDQSAAIKAEYEQLPDTIGRAMTRLRNSVLALIGDMDETTGASERIGQASELAAAGIGLIADNLEEVALVIGAAGLPLLATQAMAAATAMRSLAGSLTATATSGAAAASAVTALKQPLAAMGAAVSAVVGYELGAWLREAAQEADAWYQPLWGLNKALTGLDTAMRALSPTYAGQVDAEEHLQAVQARTAETLAAVAEQTGYTFTSLESLWAAVDKGAVVWDAASQTWTRGAVSLETAERAVTSLDAALQTQAGTLQTLAQLTAAGMDIERQRAELAVQAARAAGDEAAALAAVVEGRKQQAASTQLALGLARQDLGLAEQRLAAMQAEAAAGGPLAGQKQAEVDALHQLVDEKRLAVQQAELTAQAAQAEVAASKQAVRAYQDEQTSIAAVTDRRVTHLRMLKLEAEARGDVTRAAKLEQEINAATLDGLKQELAQRQASLDALRASGSATDAQVAAKEQEVIATREAIAAKQGETDAGAQSADVYARLKASTDAQTAANRSANQAFWDNVQAQDEAKQASENLEKQNGAALEFWKFQKGILDASTDALAQYSQEVATAVQGALAAATNIRDALVNIREISAAGLFGDQLAGDRQELAALEAGIEAAHQKWRAFDEASRDLSSVFRYVDAEAAAVAKVEERLAAAAAEAKRTEIAVAELDDALAALNDTYDDGDLGLSEYLAKLERLRGQYAALSDEDLDALNDKIRDVKDEMSDMADEGTDGLRDLRAEWADYRGEVVKALLLEQESKRIEVELALIEAKKNGNAAEIAALEQKLALLKEYQAQQLEDAAFEEAQAKIDAAQAAADEAARRASLTAEERQYEDTLAALKNQLAAAIVANDALLQQSILDQIEAEKRRHELAMANADAETKARTSSKGATTTSTASDAAAAESPASTQAVASAASYGSERTLRVVLGDSGSITIPESQERTMLDWMEQLASVTGASVSVH